MGNTEYTIRNAATDDIDSVYKIESDGSDHWHLDFFKEELKINFSRFLVTEKKSRVIAFAIAWEIDGELQLINIGVSKLYKRKGIGSALINHMVKISSHPEIIYVELKEQNREGYLFYIKNGFIRTGLRKDYYLDDNAILMEKKLL